MRTAAILPVKRFSAAKQRLGAGVQEALRDALVRTMLADVLEALTATPAIELTIIVSGQPQLPDWSGPGLTVVEDHLEAGPVRGRLAGCPARPARRASSGSCACPATAPPCPPPSCRSCSPASALGGPEVVIVPDRHGSGTNGLLLAPPDAIAPSFGPGSFERHRSLVLASGAALRVERPASLLLDIDTDVDLQALRLRLADSTGGAAADASAARRGPRRPGVCAACPPAPTGRP